MQFDGPPGLNNDLMTMIYYSLQCLKTAVLYLHLCGSMKTQNHMCPILQTACADECNIYGEVEGSLTLTEQHRMKGWSETNREGEDEKVRQMKINRERGWGVSCDVERWSWGSGRKGRP